MDITDVNNVNHIKGYTRLTTISQDGNQVIYHANPHIPGENVVRLGIRTF